MESYSEGTWLRREGRRLGEVKSTHAQVPWMVDLQGKGLGPGIVDYGTGFQVFRLSGLPPGYKKLKVTGIRAFRMPQEVP